MTDIRRLLRLGVSVMALLATASAGAGEWRTLQRLDGPAIPAMTATSELVLRGNNPSTDPLRLWLRLDDQRSTGYAERVNRQIDLPPGPFTVRLPAGVLRTPTGRALDLGQLRTLLLFQPSAEPTLRTEAVAVEIPPPLPEGVIALDLGPEDQAVFPGFAAVAPGDPRLHGKELRPRQRPSGDALLADGIEGVERIELPLSNGHWRLTLWTEDLGEWEYLPHPLRRGIHVNGIKRFERTYDADRWLREVYGRGREPEATVDGDPWQVLGRRRGGALTLDVAVTDGRLPIELSGDSRPATYLAGLLVEPAGMDALAEVDRRRTQRFAETWRTPPVAPGEPVDRLMLWALLDGESLRPDSRPASPPQQQLELIVASGSAADLDLAALAPGERLAAGWSVEGLADLGIEVRFGHWRYRRSQTLLTPVPDHLRADLEALTLNARVPRRLSLHLSAPVELAPGSYAGAILLTAGEERVRVPLTVRVLDVRLPPADRPIGTYLELPPPMGWFPELRARRGEWLACDLRTLAGFGLTGIAPPLTTPTEAGEANFRADVAAARAAGFTAPVLAYQSVPQLLTRVGREKAERQVATLADLDTEVAWSIADEPSNPGPGHPDPLELARTLRAASPGIRLAGHLNAPDDDRFLDAFDIVLINSGYGVDVTDVQRLRRQDKTPWFYNMEDRRLAAGFYLWRTDAAGYLQWHARMPTADPFDPTDGREGDFQLLYSTPEPCAPTVDIDSGLLELAAGITDLRWALWLDAQAATSPAAAALRSELRAEIPTRWEESRRLGSKAAAAWRARIQALAGRS
jgi:hypothetical protein